MGIEDLNETLSWRVIRSASPLKLAVRVATENVREVIERCEPKGVSVSLADTETGSGYEVTFEHEGRSARAMIDTDESDFVVWEFQSEGGKLHMGGLTRNGNPLDHPAEAIVGHLEKWLGSNG